MNKRQILKQVEKTLRDQFTGDSSGHDWWHTDRVRQLSIRIAKSEPTANMFIVELGALLHDVADFKFHNGDDKAGRKVATQLLTKLGADDTTIDQVCHIVEHVSYKGAGVSSKIKSLEGKIVQDADRLDGLGAIGIARTFAYGGYSRQAIYDPSIKPRHHRNFAEYKNAKTSSITHFYEKLLLLKDRMNTKTGRRLALARHKFMEKYLDKFFGEWNGKQ